LHGYANLIWTGTLFRYARANQRYFLFAIVPLVEAILLGVFAWSAPLYFMHHLSGSLLIEYFMSTVAGFILFILLLEWPGKRWRIQQAFDDWILSLDYVYGRRADLETRLDQFARRIVLEAVHGTAAEIVIVGHSLGATFAVDAVARALAIEPALGNSGRSVCVVTVGATIPKCALHPHASRLRNDIRRVADEPSVHWVEYQSRADPISFYRFHPATLQRIRGMDEELATRPAVRRVHIKDMLQPATFARYRFRVLRLHYQFVMANERRASYDYFMMICGPLLTKAWTTSPLGLLDFFQSRGVQQFPRAQNCFRDFARVQNHMVRRCNKLVRHPLPARPKEPAYRQDSNCRSRARMRPPCDIHDRPWYPAGPVCFLRTSEIC